MKATIGVYDTHDKAVKAIFELKQAGFPVKQLSVLGQGEVVLDHLHHIKRKEVLGISIGAVLGPIIGVLAGVGILAIPGLGILYGAGALAGAIGGFDIGLIGGGIASALTMLGMKDDKAIKYQQYLNEGKFLLIAEGDDKQVAHAQDVLQKHGTHDELEIH